MQYTEATQIIKPGIFLIIRAYAHARFSLQAYDSRVGKIVPDSIIGPAGYNGAVRVNRREIIALGFPEAAD